jgi:hypothetical protein
MLDVNPEPARTNVGMKFEKRVLSLLHVSVSEGLHSCIISSREGSNGQRSQFVATTIIF